ncbi:MAG: sigma-70 family RNA polymerase sigma factor [Bacteroidetes bacterium]|jgi:RNA polymerase sigma-70 factor (ECF subfamily)|nr:sigma-70 family RNA polymerase sigma factor [Bacteroidota bacterium]MBT6685982.1 sigma-70 family RNA polymerase sigma factor [Bacteroidota bacterium]MBT7144418.1 sigma-70 family RNA polymerase sigma factor [Bacteroidota bacterium]MBT7490863.1 sigma-70 family RNA polymerase sigma factor [Bacteroidota bacterium]
MVVDQQLVTGCRAADEKSQRLLYEQFSPTMFGICLSYCTNRQEAEDYLQEGFITIFNKIDKYSGEGSFIGWMRRIMINTVLMGLRAKKIENKVVSIDKINELNIDSKSFDNSEYCGEEIKSTILDAEFDSKEILEIAHTLPEGYRAVFNLYVIEGYKHKEIAKTLGIKESTSKSKLLRARKQLQQKLFDISMERKKKNKRKLVYAFAPLAMNENFKYIDEILKKAYTNLQATPTKNWLDLKQKMQSYGNKTSSIESAQSEISNSGIELQNSFLSSVSNAGSTFINFLSTHIISTLSIVTVATIGITYLSLENTNDIENSSISVKNAENKNIIETKNQNILSTENSSVSNTENDIIHTIEDKPEHSTNIGSINENILPDNVIIDTIKVPVKKTIYKTKTIRITDTIRKQKQIFRNK